MMDRLTDEVRQEYPLAMMFTDATTLQKTDGRRPGKTYWNKGKKSFTASEITYAKNEVATNRGGKARRYDEVSLDRQLGACDSRSVDPLHDPFS